MCMSENTMTSSIDANDANDATEHAVRRYLEFVADPSSAIDVGRIHHLESQIATTNDVIVKLKLHGELTRAREGDLSGLRSAFTQHAKAWAQRNEVGLDAFRALGVGDIALAEAGFDFGRTGVRKAAGAAKGSGKNSGKGRAVEVRPAPAPRAANVGSAVIRDNILARSEPFTLAGVMADVGGSLGTVRKVVDALEASGNVRNEGADRGHTGRGRAPHLFRVV